ncbi:MFS general substrate transporter [Backusella circina FSU 941]|nr:MFS general substrate transporter [Backusella circina FSU 941]
MTPPNQELSRWARARRANISVAIVVAFTLFTDMIFYGVILPTLPIIVLERLKGDSTMVGFLFGSSAIGLILSTPIFAIISDRYQNRRYPMLGGMVGLVLSTLGYATANSYSVLVLSRIAQGMAGGASWSLGLSLLADVYPTNKLGVVMGSVLAANTLGFAGGPAVGGLLFDYGGFEAPFYFCAALAVVNFFAIAWLAEPDHSGKSSEAAVAAAREDDVETISEPTETTPLVNNTNKQDKQLTMVDLLLNKRVIACVICVMVSSSVFSGIEPTLSVYLLKEYNASASLIGVIIMSMVIPAFLSPLVGHLSDTMGRHPIVASGMILTALICPVIAIQYSSIYMVIVPLVILGLSNPLTMTPLLPEMGEVVKEMGGAAYAQAYAIYNMSYSAGMFIGPMFAGLIMDYYNFRVLMYVFGISLLICSPIIMDWSAVYRKVKSFLRL